MLIIIRNLFIIFTILLFLMFFIQSPGNPFMAAFTVLVAYGFVLYKCVRCLWKFITHPVCLIRFLVGTVLRIPVFVIRFCFDPGFFFMILYPVASVYGIYRAVLAFGFIGLAAVLLLFAAYTFLITAGFKGILEVHLKLSWVYQAVSNFASKAYAQAMGIRGFHYKSPEEFEAECREDNKDFLKGNPDKKKKGKHATTIFDIRYKDELMILDLYQKDFTYEDLVHRRNELMKKNHPDNFINEKEKSEHEEIAREILQAFDKVSKEMKRTA